MKRQKGRKQEAGRQQGSRLESPTNRRRRGERTTAGMAADSDCLTDRRRALRITTASIDLPRRGGRALVKRFRMPILLAVVFLLAAGLLVWTRRTAPVATKKRQKGSKLD
jgi:hypothetical protein